MRKKSLLFYSFTLWIFLFGFWLMLSGYLDNTLLLSLGVVSCLATVLLVRRMDLMDHEGHPLYLLRLTFFYMPWLVKEIVLANLAVAKIILDHELPVDPTLIHLKPTQNTELGRVVYANSITRTPGTATLAAEEKGMLVHAIDRPSAEALLEGEMDRRVTAIDRHIKERPSHGVLGLTNEQLYATKE